MTGDDVDDDVAAGSDRSRPQRALGLPPRVIDVLRQMSPYADRLSWTVTEDAGGSVSLALVWDLQSSSTASSWRRHRRPGPAVDRPPAASAAAAAESTDVGLLQRLKRRLDRLPPTAHVTASARTSGGEVEVGSRGRGILRRCVTSLTALRLWRARQSQSSPSLSADRLDATSTKQRQLRQQRQQTVAVDNELFCRSRFTSVQVSKPVQSRRCVRNENRIR